MSFSNIGALIIVIGFGGPIYYDYKKEPRQKIVLVIIKATILDLQGRELP